MGLPWWVQLATLSAFALSLVVLADAQNTPTAPLQAAVSTTVQVTAPVELADAAGGKALQYLVTHTDGTRCVTTIGVQGLSAVCDFAPPETTAAPVKK